MPKKEIIVAVDDGSSRVKLAYLDEEKNVVCHITPSLAKRGASYTPDNQDYASGVFRLEDGDLISIDDKAEEVISNANASMYQISDVNLAATHYALHQAGFGGEDVTIVASLPIDMFFNRGGEENPFRTDIIEQKKQNLLRKIEPVRAGVELANIKKVLVVPEGITAFSSICGLQEDGSFGEVDEFESFVVFDFGESTLDVTLVKADGTITDQRFSSDLAVSKVIRLLKRKIEQKFDTELSYARVAHILRTGMFVRQDVSEEIDQAVSSVYRDIEIKVSDDIPSIRQASCIYVIGGGAPLFKEKLKSVHKSVVMPKQPDVTLAMAMLDVVNAQPIKGKVTEEA